MTITTLFVREWFLVERFYKGCAVQVFEVI
jgi:hypothetical protein